MANVKIRITQKGLAGVLRAVKRVEDALQPPSITESVGKGADVFVEGAQARAPKEDGQLSRSISKRPDDGYSWIVAPDTIYAGVQEFGATIRPKRADSLAIPGAGGPVFVKEVTIPASPYMGPTFQQDQSLAVRAVKDAIDREIG